uniref:C3H1-type domain-containing protein n=1 Tax=Haemonchus contortus TaxID=6289 RepID=A0A7I4YY42_HAECO
MAPAPPRAHDPTNSTAPPDATPAATEKFVNGNMIGTTESPLSSDSSQNLYASVDSIDDGGSQNIYAPQMLPGFLPQNQFVPVSYGPPPYAQLMEPPRFCAKCGRDATQEGVGGAEPPREQKNPFSQTERRNPFQHNPFQKGHDEKRRAPYAIRDMWKDNGDDGYGGKLRKEDETMDGQECGWKPGRGSGRNPFSTPTNNSPNQYKGREPRDSEQREKFRKPAPQCPQWEDRHHRVNNNCPLWHPYKMCLFYPNCRSTALDCGYAHPFCSEEECECAEENKDPQLNHWITPNRTYVD